MPAIGIGPPKLEPLRRQVWLDGQPVALARNEFALLRVAEVVACACSDAVVVTVTVRV
jgi:hypothetical protein